MHAGIIGETVPQLRKRFGQELIIYQNPPEHRFQINKTTQVWVTLDPDGTVGEITWAIWRKAPSEAEIQKMLRDSSEVTWRRTGDRGKYGDELHWIGSQNGKELFDASLFDTMRGYYMLNITTK